MTRAAIARRMGGELEPTASDEDSLWSSSNLSTAGGGLSYEKKSGSSLHPWEGDHVSDQKVGQESATSVSASAKGASVAHSSSNTTQAGDIKTAKSTDWAAGYVDGKASASIGHKNEIDVGKDHASSEDRIALDGGKVSATHTTSARVTNPDLDGKMVESHDRTTGVTYD